MATPSSSSAEPPMSTTPSMVPGQPKRNFLADCDFGQVIDQGCINGVPFFRCNNRFLGRKMAYKYLFKDLGREDYIKKEVQILTYLCGLPNVVRLEHVCHDSERAHLFMDLCSEESLATFLLRPEAAVAESQGWEEQVRRLFADLASALHWCHLLGVSHDALTVHTVLLHLDHHDQLQIRIAGFDNSTFFGISKETFGFLNMCMGMRNLGPILYSMLSGDLKATRPELEEAARRGELASSAGKQWLPTHTTDPARDMLYRILVKPITMTDILNHPWIKYLADQWKVPELFQLMRRLMQVTKMQPHDKVIMAILARNIPNETLVVYKNQLKSMLCDPRVMITWWMFAQSLRAIDITLRYSDVYLLLDPAVIWPDDKSVIREFYLVLFSLIPAETLIDEGNLETAFAFIDTNNDKIIDKKDLQSTIEKQSTKDRNYQAIDDVKEFRMNFRCFKNIMTRLN